MGVCFRVFAMGLAALLLAGCATTSGGTGPLVFSAMGDGPRSDLDWGKFRSQIQTENAEERSRFIVHLGDIWKGSDALPLSHYEAVAEVLKASRIPVFILPGDNEWNDLNDPATGWANWEQTFMAFERHFDLPMEVWRQEVQPENFAFVLDGVLFVGLNLVGGTVHDPAEWAQRHARNVAWVQAHLEARHDEVRAAVVMAQAAPSFDKNRDFFDPFVRVVTEFQKPVLYLHGDHHVYERISGWRTPNLTRVQVDQVSNAPPLRVIVTHNRSRMFRYDRQLNSEAYREDYETLLDRKQRSLWRR